MKGEPVTGRKGETMEENEESKSTAGLTAEEIGGLRRTFAEARSLWWEYEEIDGRNVGAEESGRRYALAKNAIAAYKLSAWVFGEALLSSAEEAQGLRDQVETLYGEIGGLHCEIEALGEERRGLRDRVASLERALDEARSIASLGRY